MTYFFGSFSKPTGEICSGFYHDWRQWYRDTFGPDIEVLALIDLSVRGSNYAERKDDLYNTAQKYLALYADSVPLSWDEVAEFQSYFETQGARYGLLTEFKTNAIC